MPLVPGARAGRTIVEMVLGSGGMATVYRVRHEDLGSLFALKVLDLVTSDLTERFRAEGRFQASLRHPNVVAVYDVLEVEGRPALLLELIEGPTLRDWMATPRSLQEVETVFRGVVAGVSAAHEVGLVHRDLKPANVLMAAGELGPIPKVADFGVAKHVGADGPTRTGLGLGTPGYMAPEQIRDAKDVDARADVFALGVILYELCCGQRPFSGTDTLDIIQASASGRYAPPNELNADLPAQFEQTIHACLMPNRALRLKNCAQILASLDGTLEVANTEETWVEPGDVAPAAPSSAAPQPADPLTVRPVFMTLEPMPMETQPAQKMATESTWRRPLLGATLAALLLAAGVGVALSLPEAPKHHDLASVESVLVRPFTVTGDDDGQYLSTALSSDISFALADAGGPRVISQFALGRYESPPAPQDLARDLNVDAVIEGRAQLSGGTVTVHSSIVRTSDAATLWTHKQSGPVGTLGGANGAVASDILVALGLAPAPPIVSEARLAAQAPYLQGREIVHRYEEARYDEAEAHLKEAIAADPTFADARAVLARLHLHRGWSGEDLHIDHIARAESEVRRALAHEPDNVRALQVLGRAMVQRGELVGAFEVLNRAIAQGGASSDAYIDRYEAEVRAGAMELAARDIKLALALDPYSVRVVTNSAWFTTYTQRWSDIDDVLTSARSLSVEHPWMTRAKAESLRRSRQPEALNAYLADHPDELTLALHTRDPAWLAPRVEKMAALATERPNAVIERARYEAALGKSDAALASLQIALTAYPGYLCHVEDPLFDDVKSLEGWPELEAAAKAATGQLTQRFAAAWTP